MLESIPAPVLVSVPESPTSSTGAEIEFTGEADAVFDCSVDGRPFVPCSSPFYLGSLNDGTHTVLVRQGNANGDVSAEVAVIAWEVDTVPPSAPTVSSNRSGTVNSDTATINFSGDGRSGFLCSVDDGDFTECGPPLQLDSLADGDHAVAVLQEDAAGNRSTGRTVEWTVDTAAPDAPTITLNRPSFTLSTSVAVGFSGAEDAGRFECRLDSGTWGSCGRSPKLYSRLADGSHTVEVRHVDDAGNASDPVSKSWTVDTVAPAVPSVTINRVSPTNRTTVTAVLSGEAGASFRCSLDGGAARPCSSPKTYSNLGPATHRIAVRQVDRAGNASASKLVTWRITRLAVGRAPRLSGSEGSTIPIGRALTASGEVFNGSSGLASVALRWQRCADGTCADIGLATSRSYSSTAADVGYSLRFGATHTSTDGASITAWSKRSGVVLASATTASAITLPDGLESPAYARPLTAEEPTWTGLPSDAEVLYRWQRCADTTTASCQDLPGATAETYTPTTFDVGRRLRVLVGGSAGGAARWVASPITRRVLVQGEATVAPRLLVDSASLPPLVGSVVAVTRGTWAYTWLGGFGYRWQSCTQDDPASCTNLNATGTSYTVPASLEGKRIRALVTYTGHDGTRVTAATAISVLIGR